MNKQLIKPTFIKNHIKTMFLFTFIVSVLLLCCFNFSTKAANIIIPDDVVLSNDSFSPINNNENVESNIIYSPGVLEKLSYSQTPAADATSFDNLFAETITSPAMQVLDSTPTLPVTESIQSTAYIPPMVTTIPSQDAFYIPEITTTTPPQDTLYTTNETTTTQSQDTFYIPEEMITAPTQDAFQENSINYQVDIVTPSMQDNTFVGNNTATENTTITESVDAIENDTTASIEPSVINPDGSVKDFSGKTYNTDGTIALPDGSFIDANGITHYSDGSVMLSDGTLYRSDGSITYPNGTIQTETGRVIKKTKRVLERELKNKERGSWKYDPQDNKWQHVESDSTLPIYK